jgi:Gram-negative bacterial TonB protein C-terminal
MNFFSDTQETARRFGDYIEDLHDIFRCNRVDFGSPQDFVAFARTVKYQSELRDYVMRVVKSLREHETNMSFRTVLTVIAVASGGPNVGESGFEMSEPVQFIVESLNSGSPCGHSNADLADSSCSDLTAEQMNSVSAQGQFPPSEEITDHRDASEYTGIENPVAETRAVDPSIDRSYRDLVSIDENPSNNFPVSRTDQLDSDPLAESLTRLELNSLQLKTYLDSIEQRITRIEPRQENPPSRVPVPSARPLELEDEFGERYYSPIFRAGGSRPEHSDLPVSNQSRVATEFAGILKNSRRHAQSVSTLRTKGSIPIFVGATTLVLVASFLWMSGRDSGNVVTRSSNALVDPDGPASLPDASAGARDASASIKKHQQDTGRVSGSEDTAVQTPKRKSAMIQFRSSPRRSLSHTMNAETHPMTSSDTSDIAPSEGPNELSSEPMEHRPFDVSSEVMAENLVSAPKPSYPLLANLTHMQGSVVMQALISTDGTVERLHVIKGHHLLRTAAKNAVQSWRYRPYKVDGVPVEVATIVSVDFSRQR